MDPFTLVALGGKLLEKVADYFPSAEAKNKAQMALLEMQQKGELAHLSAEFELAKGQLDVNKAEAANEHLFVSGWRPGFGWIGGIAFLTNYVLGPFLTWGSTLAGHPTTFPALDLTQLLPIVMGMLGLGYYRTQEKIKGVN
jgi:hypothetical protein